MRTPALEFLTKPLRDLGTSENTVKVHRGRAMKKMQAQSLPDLVAMMEQLKGSP
jgi:FixJ family two-component response regulator